MATQRIAVVTSGGDAPGMNACIRAVVRTALEQNLDVFGIQRGYRGLLDDEFIPMDRQSVSGIVHTGGTILRSGRCPEIRTEEGLQKAGDVLHRREIDGLVVIGGDGSLRGGYQIHRSSGISVIAVPASIDNDVVGTEETIGFDTAVNTALDAIDRIRDTATAHERVFVVEVMGREHGFLALTVGIASGAEVILVPEIPTDLGDVIDQLAMGAQRGKVSSLVVVAEGFASATEVASKLAANRSYEVRTTVLGYVQRGGKPTARSRFLAAWFGSAAVTHLVKHPGAWLVGLERGGLMCRPLGALFSQEKPFPRDLYEMARWLAR